MSNTNLHIARNCRNDEFYTRYEDIEAELCHYTEHFKNKVVYCNCDDWEWSNFYKWFFYNFEKLELKKLITTCLNPESVGMREKQLELFMNNFTQGKKAVVEKNNGLLETQTGLLNGNGDFRSKECKELLEEADVVVTNPPFSLISTWILTCLNFSKDLIFVGPLNIVKYSKIYPLIIANKLFVGINHPVDFITSSGLRQVGRVDWFTTFQIKKHEYLEPTKNFDPQSYLKYDNYDIINVDNLKDIPKDYKGIMGVPITFIESYNPAQFEIVGIAGDSRSRGVKCKTIINKKKKFERLLVKNRN